jgi:hypothetical protein
MQAARSIEMISAVSDSICIPGRYFSVDCGIKSAGSLHNSINHCCRAAFSFLTDAFRWNAAPHSLTFLFFRKKAAPLLCSVHPFSNPFSERAQYSRAIK